MDYDKRLKQRLLYWDYFCENKKYWGHGFTKKRLNKIRGNILCHGDLWNDVLDRHRGIDFSPNALRKLDKYTYDHCMSNMTGFIMKEFINLKIIKLRS